MDRKIFSQLQAWKESPTRKPLIVLGARQVGKTTLLKQFGALQYEQSIYLNFEENPQLHGLFEGKIKPEVLIQALSIEMNTPITPGNTLLIFDEIQECPAALNSLKYFQETANEYPIAAAGSLLGVKLKNTQGFPVGKVDFMHLYPLHFLEFLEALGEIALKNYLEDPSMKIEPLPSLLHEKFLEYFKLYLFVGGMPAAVVEYVQTKDLNRVRTVQQGILTAYQLDFAKHAPPTMIMKINQVWGSIASQLAKENKKFIYSVIRKGARAKEFEAALQWLTEAGLIHKIYQISAPKVPLKAYAYPDFFKVYLLDVGLLGAMTNLSAKTILHGSDIFQEFRGALVENYVAEELVHTQEALYYWVSEGEAELDFVINHQDTVIPLEVKSGGSSKKKSLQTYAQKYGPVLSVRGSPMNLRHDGALLNCPLYLVGNLATLLSQFL